MDLFCFGGAIRSSVEGSSTLPSAYFGFGFLHISAFIFDLATCGVLLLIRLNCSGLHIWKHLRCLGILGVLAGPIVRYGALWIYLLGVRHCIEGFSCTSRATIDGVLHWATVAPAVIDWVEFVGFPQLGNVGFAILWQISDSRNITMIDNTMSYHSRIPTKYNRRDQLLHGVCEERFPGLFPGSSMKRSVHQGNANWAYRGCVDSAHLGDVTPT